MPEVSAPEETFSPTNTPSGGTKPFGVSWSTIIISTVVAALLLGGALALYKVGKKPSEQTVPSTNQSSPSAKQASPSAQKGETEDWKLYPGVGFTFKYPSKWKHEVATHGNILFTDESKIIINLDINSFEGKTYSEYVSKVIKDLSYPDIEAPRREQTTVDGKQTTKVVYKTPYPDDGVKIAILIDKNGKEALYLEISEKDLPLVDKILSTFKFLD